MEKQQFEFDDLFESKENKHENYNTPKVNNYDKSRGIIIILTYFLFFIVLSEILVLIFFSIPSTKIDFTATEHVVYTLKKEKGVSFTTVALFDSLEDKDSVDHIIFGEYVVLLTKGLFTEEEMSAFTSYDIQMLYIGNPMVIDGTHVLRINNAEVSGFFYEYVTPTFDISLNATKGITTTAGLITNFIVYLAAGIVLVYMSFKVLKMDFALLPKDALKILSMIGMGYLFLIAGNIISSTLSSILSVLLNHQITTSANQAGIYEFLKTPFAVLIIIPIVIGAPIVEELVFRKGFFSIIKNKWLALVLGSLLFGLIHVLSEATFAAFLINLIVYSSSGFAFGFVYIYYKENIYAPMFIHAVSNLVSVLAFYLMPSLGV